MDFDKNIKEIIEGASELPDSSVWERIEGTMRRRSRRVAYFRRGAVLVASAAAVVSLFMLGTLNLHKQGDNPVNQGQIAVVSERPASAPSSDKLSVPASSASKVSSSVSKVSSSVSVSESVASGVTTVTISGNNNQRIDLPEFKVNNNLNLSSSVAQISDNIHLRSVNQANNSKVAISEIPTSNSKAISLEKKIKNSPYTLTFADEEPVKAVKKRRISAGVYTNISSPHRSLAQMYSRGFDLENTQTFMAAGAPYSLESDSKYYTPASVGVQLQIPVAGHVSVGTGAVYSFLRSDIKTTVSDSYSYTLISEIQYIGIPLNLIYNIQASRSLRLYANLGAMFEKGLNNSQKVTGTGNGDGEMKDGIDPVALSFNGGIGIEYMLGKSLGLYADPGLSYFMDTNQPLSIRTVQPLQFKCEVGIRLHL